MFEVWGNEKSGTVGSIPEFHNRGAMFSAHRSMAGQSR